jgi:hypothetical protein
MTDLKDVKKIIKPFERDWLNSITERIIGCAIEGHRNLGPVLIDRGRRLIF